MTEQTIPHNRVPARRPALTVGMLPAPGLATDMNKQVIDDLVKLLAHHVDDRYRWQVSPTTDPLIGAQGDTTHILAKAEEYKPNQQWHYVVCVTDLPMLRSGRLVVAEISVERGVAVLSLPALGALRLKRKLREAVLQLINELHHGSSNAARLQQQQHVNRQHRSRLQRGLRKLSARNLVGKRVADQFAPIIRERVTRDVREIDVRFIAPHRFRGFYTLLVGMVRANQPLSLIPTFRRVLAVAFASGAYALIYQQIWLLSDDYGSGRLIALMCCAISAMVAWFIIDHHLWARQYDRISPLYGRIYNLTTVFTLLIGVIHYYIMLVVLFLVTVGLLVTPALFTQALGHDISWLNYPRLAWLAASIATIAGTLGGSLESDDTVRNATYGYRQRARYQQAREAERFQPGEDDEY